nr:hypothetical protein [uncultured Celeribacter sp.]
MTPRASWRIAVKQRRLADLVIALAGVFDGLRDGGHLVGLELLAVTLPGVVALIFTWRHIRSA